MSRASPKTATDPDYSGLMGEVALALLGEPTSKHHGGLEWRYGRYGSLSIDLHKNVYYDHEAGQGGGVLDLIVRENGGDHRDAVEWLDAKGMRITSNATKNGQTIKQTISGRSTIAPTPNLTEAVAPPLASLRPITMSMKAARPCSRSCVSTRKVFGSDGQMGVADTYGISMACALCSIGCQN